ncbi:MAG TPA: DNA-directed RNA polymerase subunit K [Thermoplasmata archaeon]|nr:DNA-directed RNA polymerase subunit K [Thermoplasmata archaeon]
MAEPLSVAGLPATPSGALVSSGASVGDAGIEYTRFERARILGARALQISLGAPILIEVPVALIDPVEIAEREFAAGMIPITVRRGVAR